MFKVIREEIYRLEIEVELFWNNRDRKLLKIDRNIISETRSVIDNAIMEKNTVIDNAIAEISSVMDTTVSETRSVIDNGYHGS